MSRPFYRSALSLTPPSAHARALAALGLSAGLVLAFTAPAAHAQASAPRTGPYVGAALGWGNTGFRDSDFSAGAIAADLGLAASQVSAKDRPNTLGLKLSGGYRFNDWLGAELGLVSLGKAKVDYQVPAISGSASANYTVRATTLAAVASTHVAPDLSLYGKVGAAFTQAKNEVRATLFGVNVAESDKVNKTNLYLGVGAAYRLSSNVSLTAEYENFGTVGNSDKTGRARAQLVSLGVRYDF
jgi:OOP family OmpA-OmpF porin